MNDDVEQQFRAKNDFAQCPHWLDDVELVHNGDLGPTVRRPDRSRLGGLGSAALGIRHRRTGQIRKSRGRLFEIGRLVGDYLVEIEAEAILG